jgi:hypothetical protein
MERSTMACPIFEFVLSLPSRGPVASRGIWNDKPSRGVKLEAGSFKLLSSSLLGFARVGHCKVWHALRPRRNRASFDQNARYPQPPIVRDRHSYPCYHTIDSTLSPSRASSILSSPNLYGRRHAYRWYRNPMSQWTVEMESHKRAASIRSERYCA